MAREAISTVTIPVEVPTFLERFMSSRDELATRLKRALIMEMFFNGEISQGKATELLEIPVHDMLDLIAEYQSPGRGPTAEDMLEDVRRLEAAQRERAARASD